MGAMGAVLAVNDNVPVFWAPQSRLYVSHLLHVAVLPPTRGVVVPRPDR